MEEYGALYPTTYFLPKAPGLVSFSPIFPMSELSTVVEYLSEWDLVPSYFLCNDLSLGIRDLNQRSRPVNECGTQEHRRKVPLIPLIETRLTHNALRLHWPKPVPAIVGGRL